MVDQNLINELAIDDAAVVAELGGMAADWASFAKGVDQAEHICKPGTILKGRIIGRAGDDIVVDVGLKSEGTIAKNEWDQPDAIDAGDLVDVWLEAIESDTGQIVLSKRKADRALNWKRIVDTNNEGDLVTGRVMRKIKGGLLVDIGVPVFLPASQVDIRRPPDIGEFIGKEIQAKILKIDTDRRNIVISRREMIEQERSAAKAQLLNSIEVGQIRSGKVKNIANFGVFVDLGGIDGLLHITDMSWDRVGHPSEIVKIDQVIEVKVLHLDCEKEKIALGLKQLTPNPWTEVQERYPIGSHVKGEVVNITNYGAFVKLEPGVEGLVHISEMTWTRRINHPSELLTAGQQIEAVVLEVNTDKQEISLGIKQIEANPWTQMAEKYPPNTRITGRVRNLTNYGVFVEIEEGIDGLLHISDMSWTKKIGHPSEMLKKGDTIECVVLKVEQNKQRIALGLRQLHEDPWLKAVPANYIPGQIVEGKVTKITNFGVFVELEPDLEGLLHVSELADHKVEDPHSEVKTGERIQVKILRVDPEERKIGLSKKRAVWSAQQQQEAEVAEKPPKTRRGGLHTLGTEFSGLQDLTSATQTPSTPDPRDAQPSDVAPKGVDSEDTTPQPEQTQELMESPELGDKAAEDSTPPKAESGDFNRDSGEEAAEDGTPPQEAPNPSAGSENDSGAMV